MGSGKKFLTLIRGRGDGPCTRQPPLPLPLRFSPSALDDRTVFFSHTLILHSPALSSYYVCRSTL